MWQSSKRFAASCASASVRVCRRARLTVFRVLRAAGPAWLRPAATDGRECAVASLILGILSFLCLSILAGIPAIILGHISKSNIRKSMGRLKGGGMATAGLIMGYISVSAIPILIIAAIAIPNLLRSRIVANEAAAASTVRTLNTMQMSYSVSYPAAGYAKSLVVLGPGQPPIDCADTTRITSDHACLVDRLLGCADGTWCTKGGYNYSMTAICSGDGTCSDYVVVATPAITGSTGTKSFCSTSDGIVRSLSRNLSATRPRTVEECQSWPAL